MNIKQFNILNLFVSILILNIVHIFSLYYNTHLNLETTRFFKYNNLKNNSIKIVNLGSSHGFYGIKYNSISGMNLAKDSQDIYYDLKLLQKYSDKLEKNAIIVVPISIFTFYSIGNEKIDKNYISLLKFKDIKNINLKDYIMARYFSLIYPPQRITETLKFIKNNGINKKIYYTQRVDLDRDKLEIESQKTVDRHLKKERDIYGKLIKKAEQNIFELVEYILINNWEPIFITTPFSYLYNEGIEKIDKSAYEDRIYKNIENLEKKYNRKFFYIDYSHDKRFERNLEYFFDDDHLNEKGAEYFTQILLEDIKLLKKIKN